MSRQLYPRQQQGNIAGSESGFVLVVAMVVLLVLSLLGAWALNTSKSELDVAGGLQRAERQFNISEGGTSLEAVKVGFALEPHYVVGDPSIPNQLLTPPDEATFDPGGDTAAVPGAVDATDTATWPVQNLLQDNADDEFDYRYLVTYLNAGLPPKGFDATTTSSYNWCIQSMAPVVIEVGGMSIGSKFAL